MEQIQTATITAIVLMSIIGASSLSDVNERSNANQDSLEFLYTEGLPEMWLQDEWHLQLFERNAVEVQENITANRGNITTLAAQISDLRIDAIEADIANLSDRLDAQAAILQNNAPVIYFRMAGPKQGNNEGLYISAIDTDGQVVSLGIDGDLDGVVDVELQPGGNSSDFSTITRYADSTDYWTISEPHFTNDGDMDGDGPCEARSLIIAIDDDGARSLYPVYADASPDDWELCS
jgi:hypothetical protein